MPASRSPDSQEATPRPIAVDPDTAARLVDVTRTHLYRYLKSNGPDRLPSVKLGSRRIIRLTDLHRWLRRMERVTAEDEL